MGTEYYAYTFIGLPVEEKKLFIKEKVKTFEHSYPKNWKVHPITKKELWEITENPIKGFDGNDTMDTSEKKTLKYRIKN